jgi:hypothetical protein
VEFNNFIADKKNFVQHFTEVWSVYWIWWTTIWPSFVAQLCHFLLVGGCMYVRWCFLELSVISVQWLYVVLYVRLVVLIAVHYDCTLNGVELTHEISNEISNTCLTVISVTYFCLIKHHILKTWTSVGTVLCILYSDSSWTLVVSLIPQLLYI